MSAQHVYDTISTAGIPIAHIAWPKGKAPDLPWAVYRLDSNMAFEADNVNYVENPRWEVDLYQKSTDQELEHVIEEAIAMEFGPYSKSETWLSDENCHATVYLFREWSSNV